MSGSSMCSVSTNSVPRGCSGCSTGSPSATAISLIGGATSVERERPTGRSGCVTSAATSKPSPINAESEGQANVNVPQKRTRTSELLVAMVMLRDGRRNHRARERAVTLAHLLPFALGRLLLHKAQVVDEQLAVQVIVLVLNAPREELLHVARAVHRVGVELERLPLAIERAHDHAGRALHIAVHVRD